MKIEFKPPKLDNLVEQIKKTAQAKVEEVVVEKVGKLRCSQHHKQATVTFSGISPHGRQCSIQGCCPEFIEEVRNHLGI